jgi:hypothetical protein
VKWHRAVRRALFEAKKRMKKARKENATLKRFCEKRAILKKFINENHLDVIEEHIRVFLLSLACKKNALCAVGEGA